jgi:S-DNA-T family DNA segregation ATPase FtsK/SpoIIIE
MVDPKRVELSLFDGIPHLVAPVAHDAREAAGLLRWAMREMEMRYQLFADAGVRNIAAYNEQVALEKSAAPLYYLVIVIDELADLMMQAATEFEASICRLAQLARATGIHIVVATQRPSVNVITGLIKANFPSRIAFRVASQVDSRTIIDGAGAETLLGNGDMLFIAPAKSEPARMQGAYIASDETERLMKWFDDKREARRAALAEQGLVLEEPMYAEDDIITKVREKEAMEANQGEGNAQEASDRDVLFRDAAETVIQHQQGSTSLLQRRLKVGYGRAARIIDQLNAAGVLGPPDGSKPREVLVGLEDLDRICGPRG